MEPKEQPASTAPPEPKVDLGSVVITATALNELEPEAIRLALLRHMTGDWGSVDQDDWLTNNLALSANDPQRILSAYESDGTTFWIITEWDRSVTTVLLPEDY